MSEQNTVNYDKSLAQENAALKSENAILKEQLALMQEQFEWLKKQMFGRKTEQTSVVIGNDNQLSFFPDEVQAVSAALELSRNVQSWSNRQIKDVFLPKGI